MTNSINPTLRNPPSTRNGVRNGTIPNRHNIIHTHSVSIKIFENVVFICHPVNNTFCFFLSLVTVAVRVNNCVVVLYHT